jgi:beta-lactamase class A
MADSWPHRTSGPRGAVVLLAFLLGIAATAGTVVSDTPFAAGAPVVSAPSSPVGAQLAWFLGTTARLPLTTEDFSTHFDADFRARVSVSEFNNELAALGPPDPMTLVQVSPDGPSSLRALATLGSLRFEVQISVDSSGLIAGLLLKLDQTTPPSWSVLDHQLSALAPSVSFLAAKVSANGSCTTVHALAASTARPLGSMFKLFVLGALANAVHHHTIRWDQDVTVTAAVKVGGSGTLQAMPDGTRITVEQAAIKMISVSDNTAADILLKLVGRAAVESQVRKWSSHPSLDIPFLTVSEAFALKYADYPAMEKHYLALGPAQRAAFLTSTVDAVPESSEQGSATPRAIDSIEWFASANDLCRAFAGLRGLQSEPGLSPLSTVLSTNNGGIGLPAKEWPRIWFKGGSEKGVLTLGYLGRDAKGNTYVVIALTSNRTQDLGPAATAQLVGVVSGAFLLLH